MGMFDTIRCNYDAGAGFHNRELQTKDLECMMFEYWITPHGQLYQIDYSGTQSIVDSGAQDFRIVTVPNGNHGKITAMDITKTIEVYPSKWDAHYAPFPRLYFHFRDGVINWVSKPGSNRL
jgi:hypothetical protein